MELSLPGAKVPGSESSRERKFHPMELSLLGAKVPRSESSSYLQYRPLCYVNLFWLPFTAFVCLHSYVQTTSKKYFENAK